MPRIEMSFQINAPIDRCFDLSRTIELHQSSTGGTNERAIAGVTHGLMNMGDQVTWRAKHLGVYQNLTSRISAFHYPYSFTDTMVSGAFKSIEHQHIFTEEGDGTRMKDIMYFEAPLGILGRFACFLFLTAYMRKFLYQRNLYIKKVAEGEEWKMYLVEN